MKSLSPSAQSVLDAVASQMEGGWISPDYIPYEAKKIAAAFRAAAGLQVSSSFDGTLYETGEDEFRAFLHYIAAELEAAQPAPSPL